MKAPPVLRRDEPPTIAGSSAGFIALIVCLVIILLVSTSTIVYLLHRERYSNNPKRYADRRKRKSDQRGVANTSPVQHPQSWAKFFRRAPSNSPSDTDSSRPAQDGRGWYQTGSGDSWDYTTPQLAEIHRTTAVPYSYPNSSHTLSSPPSMDYHEQRNSRFMMSPVHENLSRSTHEEMSESHKLPTPLPSASLHSGRNSPSLYPTLLSSRAFLSSPSPSPTEGDTTLPRLTFVNLPEGSLTPQRTDSPGGETIRRTFEGGSKFLEAL